MTDLTHPLTRRAAKAREDTKRGDAFRVPSFTEVVYAHSDWWRELQQPGGPGPAEGRYRDVLERFEKRYGQIVTAYWCTHVQSAAALTERKRRLPWLTPLSMFHRESDWVTQYASDVARELYRCDELAVRSKIVLKGVRQRICLGLVMASAAHLLGLVDGPAGRRRPAETAGRLEQERRSLDAIEVYYRGAANGQAQIVYFTGMIFMASLITLVVALLLGVVGWVYATLAFGAFGGMVSVMQRISARRFDLEYDVGRPYAFFLGGLRPLIGGAFALAIAFAFTSGFLRLPLGPETSTTDRHFFLAVIAFLAGFSERFAKDMLGAIEQAAVPPTTASSAGRPPPME